MNIRQLHDELRKSGRVDMRLDGKMILSKASDGFIVTPKGISICHVSDLERDDWTCERKASR